jgi:hypothetical protein
MTSHEVVTCLDNQCNYYANSSVLELAQSWSYKKESQAKLLPPKTTALKFGDCYDYQTQGIYTIGSQVCYSDLVWECVGGVDLCGNHVPGEPWDNGYIWILTGAWSSSMPG